MGCWSKLVRSTSMIAACVAVNAGGAVLSGFAQATPAPASDPASSRPETALPSALFAKSEPAGAKPIGAAIASAKPGDRVTVKARIADGPKAFNPDHAAFAVIDLGSDKPASPPVAIVKVLDEQGVPIAGGLKGRTPLVPRAAVSVVGTLTGGGPDGVPVINAESIYVPPSGLPVSLFLAAAPAESRFVEEVKASAKAGDTVAVRGRIGGSADPFVDGRAVFTIVGSKLKACSDNADDHCTQPWDYCCETKKDIAAHSATVQVTDESGKLLRVGLKGWAGLAGLSDVTVVGKAVVSDGKSLVVRASGIYIHE